MRTSRDVRPEDLRGSPCACYVRDSTQDQAEGVGPDIQRRHNRDFIERYGLVDTGLVYEEYVSGGRIDRRTAIHHALADMRARRFRVLLVGWTHRFARSIFDAEWLKREIDAAGGILVYTAQGIISGQKATRISERVHHILDEEYRSNLSDVMADSLYEKFEQGGANGRPPLGARHLYVRRDGTIAEGPERNTRAVRVLDERELPTLRELLRRYAQVGSYRETAATLNANGYRTRHGGLFTKDTVKEIVRNPFYSAEEVVWYHPGQPDEERRATPRDRSIFPSDIHELWAQAQERRRTYLSRSGPETAARVYPLHPVLRCATCGSQYHGQVTRGETRRSFHVRPLKGCNRPRGPQAVWLEDQLVEALSYIPLPEDWRSSVARLVQMPRVDESAERRTRLMKMVEKLRYQHLIEAIDDATFRQEYGRLRRQLEAIPEPGPTELQHYREPAQLFGSVGKILGHPAVRRRRDAMQWFGRFCEAAFSRIEVDGGRLVSITPRARYRELFAVSLAESSAQMVWNGAAEGTRTPTPFTGTWT